MSFKKKLEARKSESVDLSFCLDRPLKAQLEQAKLDAGKNASKRMAGGKDSAVEKLEKQVADASVRIRFTGLGWRKYNEVIEQHPPREGFDESFNSATFFEAAARLGAEEVHDDGTTSPIEDEDWDEFIEDLTDGEFDRLAGAVVQVNRNVGTVDTVPLA